jgi:hypothetical protein
MTSPFAVKRSGLSLTPASLLAADHAVSRGNSCPLRFLRQKSTGFVIEKSGLTKTTRKQNDPARNTVPAGDTTHSAGGLSTGGHSCCSRFFLLEAGALTALFQASCALIGTSARNFSRLRKFFS